MRYEHHHENKSRTAEHKIPLEHRHENKYLIVTKTVKVTVTEIETVKMT